MKKNTNKSLAIRILLTVLLVVSSLSAVYAEEVTVLTADDVYPDPVDGTFDLVIRMDFETTETLVGFNFSLTLPEGVDFNTTKTTAAAREKCCDFGELIDEDVASDGLTIRERAEGGYLFSWVDQDDKTPLLGTKGVLLTIKLKANDPTIKDIGRIFNIGLANILDQGFATFGNGNTIADVQFGINQVVNNTNSKGDVQKDGVVDVADIAAIWSVMTDTGNYDLMAADVNGDGTVDVADISTVLSIMASKSYTGNPNGKTVLTAEPIVIGEDGTGELVLKMNYETTESVVGWNFSLYLPEGLEVVHDGTDFLFDISSDLHTNALKKWGEMKPKSDGGYLLYCFDSSNETPMSGTVGTLISITLKATGTINGTGSIRGIAMTNALSESLDLGNIADTEFNITQTGKVAMPTFTRNGRVLTISTTTDGASIYYTLDGTTPTTGSTLYKKPITLSQNCTVRAIAVKDGYVDSDVASLAVTNFVTGLSVADVAMTTREPTTIYVTPVPANGLYDPSLVTPTVTTSDDIPDGWHSLELERLSENGLQWSATAYSLGTYTINILYDGKLMGSGTVNVGQQLNLKDGWQWLALQGGTIGKGSLESVFGGQLDEARSETAMVINDPQAGYWGTLETMDYTETYKVRMDLGNSEHTYDIMGAYHNMMLNSITRDLHVGWNWVGNPYQYWQDINDIFTNGSKFTEGDIVKTKTQFATYTNAKWQPTVYVEPGSGMIVYKQAAGQIGFNSEYGMSQNFTSPAASRSNNVQSPLFNVQSVERHFDDNMAMIARVEGVSDPSAITMWAFVGDECRGQSTGVGDLQFITVHGQQGEHFSFKSFDHTTGLLYQIRESHPFMSISGSAKAPVTLHVGPIETAIVNVEGGGLGKANPVYDLQGRRVKSPIFNSPSSIQKKGIYIQSGHKVVIH